VPAIVAGYLLIYFFVGERVPYNGGLGFDGYFYGHLAADFPGMLARKVPDYYLDRILPSFVVWLSARVLSFDLSTPATVVAAFHVYNSILLMIAAFAWVRIAQALKLSTEIAVIGAACLFLNWNLTTQYLYFAVLTDATAFSLGVVAALCAVQRRYFSLAVAALIASFSFKLVMPMALLWVVFAGPAPERPPLRWQASLAIGAAVIAGAAAVYAAYALHFDVGYGGAPIDAPTLPLSIAVLMLYVCAVAWAFPVNRVFGGLAFANMPAVVFFVALWAMREAILVVLARYFANDTTVYDYSTFILGSLATAVAKPGVFLVAHVAALGPGVILLLVYLRRVCNAAADASAGWALFLGATLVLALNSESRKLAFVYPFVVMVLCRALRDVDIRPRFAVCFVICSIVISRCYLPLNALGMQTIEPGIMTDFTQLLRFPWQWFFMNVGHYMGWAGYAINLALALAAAAVLIAMLPHEAGDLKAGVLSVLQRRRGGAR